MDAATLGPAGGAPAGVHLDLGHVRDVVLLRIAFAGRPVARDALIKELAPLTAHAVKLEDWRAMVERDLAVLSDAGLVDLKASSVSASDAGTKRAAMVLGGRGAPPKTWSEARDIWLVAKALGLENEPATRLKPLAKPEGLRAAVVRKTFTLKIRGAPTPTRLRVALAQVALARAFGSEVKTGAPAKSGLSPKAGRVLAGQLAKKPQDFRTDARLIAALAADAMGIEATDFASLQLAVLRRYVTKGQVAIAIPNKRVARRQRRAKTRPVAPVPVNTSRPPQPTNPVPMQAAITPSANERPDLQQFANDVRALSVPVAEGWVGNRKAFISRVWQQIRQHRSRWVLTEIEFKCMLAEAHRLGQILLANADLKDGRNLKEVQDSAVVYKNTVFHFVRIDE